MTGRHHIINDYIAGAVSGAAGLVVGHPFDTTKVQLQTRQTSSPYKGAWDAIRSISNSGIVRGFYRGLSFPLVSYGLVNSVFFGVYGNTLYVLKGADKTRRATYSEVFLAGCCGGVVQLLVACPVDVIKVVLQSQIKKGGESGRVSRQQFFRGPGQCALWLYRQHGVKGLYRGYTAMLLRDAPTYGVYTMVYAILKDTLRNLGWLDQAEVGACLISGGMAGISSWLLAVPFDVVKSLMQADQQQKYTSMRHCARTLYRLKGLRGFYTGVGVVCVRAFLVSGVVFLSYEQTIKSLANHSVP